MIAKILTHWACQPVPHRARRFVESIYSKNRTAEKSPANATLLALRSTERRDPEIFCALTDRSPAEPTLKEWVFHQAEKRLTILPVLRYSSRDRKRPFKIPILFASWLPLRAPLLAASVAAGAAILYRPAPIIASIYSAREKSKRP